MTKMQVANSLPLSARENADFRKYAMSKGVIGVANAIAPNITTPNINAPLGALAYIRPKAIEVLTAPRTADKISVAEKNGVWGDKVVQIKIKEYEGTTSTDDGSAGDGKNVSVNYDFVTRGVYQYRADWNTNDLSEAQIGQMAENARADLANGAMETLAIDRNKFFFKGVTEKGLKSPVYGLLNDPALLAYQTVKSGSSTTNPTYWENKTPDEIYNDVIDAETLLAKQSAGKSEEAIADGAKVILAVATGSMSALYRTNSFGLTAMTKLKEKFGSALEIVGVPQFNSADSNSDVFYLIIKPADKSVIINSYVEMARAYPIFQHSSEVSQKLAGATSGCVVQYPFLIARCNGIGQSTAV